MKKIIVTLLAFLLLVSLVGCDKDGISDNWADMEFKLADKKYKLPEKFSTFSGNGWILYGDADLAAGDYTTDMFQAFNEDFYEQQKDLYLTIVIDFENYGKTTKNVKECDVYWISLSKIFDGEEMNNIYEIELAKGIKWGSTEQEIVAAYGQPLEVNRELLADEGIIRIIYESTNKDIYSRMVMFLFEDGGLYLVMLSKYPN